MLRYTLRRLAFLPLILIVVSIFTFMLLRVLPTQDIADVIGGSDATAEQKEAIREKYGLNDPLYEQYFTWLGNAVRGDFGNTFSSDQDVRTLFWQKLPPSFEIVFLSLIVSVVVGISFGILSAMYRNSIADYNVRVFAVLGASIPEFFLLTLLIIIPSYLWNYSQPVGGYVPIWEDPWTNVRLFFPAAIIIGIAGAAALMRLVRTTMLEVLRSDYIRTAQAKGLRQRTVIVSHALRNASTPILTAVGAAFITVFAGSVIAERVLSINGVGLWTLQSTFSRDLPVIQFLALYTATVVVLVNLVVDLSYAWADPRVKYS